MWCAHRDRAQMYVRLRQNAFKFHLWSFGSHLRLICGCTFGACNNRAVSQYNCHPIAIRSSFVWVCISVHICNIYFSHLLTFILFYGKTLCLFLANKNEHSPHSQNAQQNIYLFFNWEFDAIFTRLVLVFLWRNGFFLPLDR